MSAGSEVGWSPIVCTKCRSPLGIKEIPPIVQGMFLFPMVHARSNEVGHLYQNTSAYDSSHIVLPRKRHRHRKTGLGKFPRVCRPPIGVQNSDSWIRSDTLEGFVAKHLLACSSIHTVYRFIFRSFESVAHTEPRIPLQQAKRLPQ